MAKTAWEFGDTTYLLNEAQTEEVDAYSESEPDDAKFNAWFKEYVHKNSVEKKVRKRAAYWTHMANTSDDLTKMVHVKQSALTLMRVVDPSIKPSDVDFDQADGGRGATIVIPSQPGTSTATLHDAVDNTAGFAIHAAFDNLFGKHYMPRDKTKQQIRNAIESLRVDRLGLKDNPGFAGYIDSAFEYMYNGYKIPTEWPVEDVGEQLAALLAPSLYGSRVGDWTATEYADKVRKAQKVADRYSDMEYPNLSDSTKAIDSIYDLLDIPPDQKAEEPVSVPVPMSPGEQNKEGELDAEMKDKIDGRIEMEQEIVNAPDGKESKQILKIKPRRESYPTLPKVTGDILKADALLRLRKTMERKTERFQRSGELDEDELYRLMQGDDRVFMNTEEEQEEAAAIHFLIDASGSMGGSVDGWWGHGESKVVIATRMAWLMAHSMNKRTYVKSHVWAHTAEATVMGGGDYHHGPIVYDIWQNGDPLDRLDIVLQVDHSQNADGYAIEYVGKKVLEEDAERKYLIVLSDGQPAASYYGGPTAMDHVREVTDTLIRKSVHVVQIAIGKEMGPAEQAKMFKHFVIYENINQTIREFAKLLDKAR